MHGRNLQEYKAKMRDPKVVAALQHKATQWTKLSKGLLVEKDPVKVLELTSHLLVVHPDPLYFWNHRRRALQQQEAESPIDWQEEFKLTQACLERHPKAYGAWFHRKWCIMMESSSSTTSTPKKMAERFQKELVLVSAFLERDERNFHGWNYRRFVVSCLIIANTNNDGTCDYNGGLDLEDDRLCLGPQVGNVVISSSGDPTETSPQPLSPEVLEVIRSEFAFTTTKISQNFSNGSAFHYRALLLPILLNAEDDGGASSSLWESELELVHNALFTEPEDQTAWWYWEFLWDHHHHCTTKTTTVVELLETEANMLEELVEAEQGQTKWGLLGWQQILKRLDQLGVKDNGNHNQKRKDILESLKRLDPDRKGRYTTMQKEL